MASSSRKKPAPSLFSPLGLLAATFYRREEDSRTSEALSDVRKADMALRKVLEAVQGMDMKRQGIAIEEASQALGVLRARVRKQKELALRVGEGEKKEREKMEDMERETVECHMTTAGLLRQAEEVREDILSVRKEIENRRCRDDSGEETGSEDCGRGNSKLCIRTLASGDWDDSLDNEFDD